MTGFTVVDPFTGQTGTEVPFASDQEVQAAIAKVDDAWHSWARETTVADRAAAIAKVAEIHLARVDELAAIITREMGKPRPQAVGEVEFAAAIYQYYADNAEALLADEPIAVEGGRALLRKAPLGPLLGIMPWNFPYYQVARFAGPNLIVGNPILLKHAPQCPDSALVQEQIFHEAGIPVNAYVNIFASTDQIEPIIADRRVRGVSLTGSERAGAAVAEIAGRHLKKVALELGGSDPFIVLGSDDLDATVEAAVAGRLDNGGQSCNAAKRFIVIDSLYDAFAEKFTAAIGQIAPGDPTSDDTELGPLSSEAAAERLDGQVKRAIENGATALLEPQPRQGTQFFPGVLADIDRANPAFGEEFFGPVASLYRVHSEDEAIEVANGTDFGLGSYVFTPDEEQALRVADRIESGMVFINVVGAEAAELPFGGVKQSGTGRELGAVGIGEFLNRKMIRLPE
ncbi:NAD-dependent succinate-semialdehyde dehydrogenase [Schumannella sp. 10F1B-5-1]|uniref:NAD-dependent succinate-semialdehyde dehydrogenase n=1 Tax=Schumannella sp. 10F1B-5-1 TaxID=2590780 RepID=UPI0011308150|nr:NAD-dependent succinate-semialdehyde dehydrogenase [Schumannella sp. 10F1B-5-1]TPW72955.1 NAD-dependent succinate-semialdehyde dehydrogenase [Schumannella sp. 10F1B-5-1]